MRECMGLTPRCEEKSTMEERERKEPGIYLLEGMELER